MGGDHTPVLAAVSTIKMTKSLLNKYVYAHILNLFPLLIIKLNILNLETKN